MRETFLLKTSWNGIFADLSEKQAGALIKALYQYNCTDIAAGDVAARLTDGEVRAYFNIMVLDCAKFRENYDRKAGASRENGKKGAEYGKLGGRPRKEKPLKTPRNPHKDKDNDSSPLPPVGGKVRESFSEPENRNPYPSLCREVAEEFDRYRESLEKPLNDYQCKLKIGELLTLTDQPEEQLLILRHTIANGWKKLVVPEGVGESILARRLAEEVAEREARRSDPQWIAEDARILRL